MPPSPSLPSPARSRRLSWRAIGLIAAAWAALAGGALGLAHYLDRPVGSAAPDAARPAVGGPVVAPQEDTTAASLPPLALIVGRSPPADVARLAPARQAQVLRSRAAGAPSARLLIDLGIAEQRLRHPAAAAAAFRRALRVEPGSVEARAGLAMSPARGGAVALAAAAQSLARLARQHPRSQVVAFNEGWVAIYRSRAQEAERSWGRTVDLGPGTAFGRTAQALLDRLRTASNPTP